MNTNEANKEAGYKIRYSWRCSFQLAACASITPTSSTQTHTYLTHTHTWCTNDELTSSAGRKMRQECDLHAYLAKFCMYGEGCIQLVSEETEVSSKKKMHGEGCRCWVILEYSRVDVSNNVSAMSFQKCLRRSQKAAPSPGWYHLNKELGWKVGRFGKQLTCWSTCGPWIRK